MAKTINPVDTEIYKMLFDEIYSNPDVYKKLLTSEDANKQIEWVNEAFFNIFGDVHIQKSKYESFDKVNVFVYIKVSLTGSRKHTYNLYIDRHQSIRLDKWTKPNIEVLCKKLVAWELECKNLYRRYQPYSWGAFTWTTEGDVSTGKYWVAKGVTLTVDHKKWEFFVDTPKANFVFKPNKWFVNLEQYKTVSVRFLNAIKMIMLNQKEVEGIYDEQ